MPKSLAVVLNMAISVSLCFRRINLNTHMANHSSNIDFSLIRLSNRWIFTDFANHPGFFTLTLPLWIWMHVCMYEFSLMRKLVLYDLECVFHSLKVIRLALPLCSYLFFFPCTYFLRGSLLSKVLPLFSFSIISPLCLQTLQHYPLFTFLFIVCVCIHIYFCTSYICLLSVHPCFVSSRHCQPQRMS